ncbi:MAG TPA: PEP-CTERM sorting domain-containing protein [Rhodopila sp.]|nr:PEP-CTERM sorting domain-containing protein [Rhodopila sp.]
MRIGLKATLAAAAMTALVAAHNAHATPSTILDNANVGGSYGNVTTDTGSLGSATVLTLGSANIGSLLDTYTPLNGTQAPNTFVYGPNTLTSSSATTTIGSLSLSNLSGNTFSDTINDFLTFQGTTGLYEFDVTSLAMSVTSQGGAYYLNIDAFGTLVDQSDNYEDTNAAASLTFTQTGGSGSIIGGYTLGSPPNFTAPPSVPEPMSLSLLGGGLAALGVIRRRKKAC